MRPPFTTLLWLLASSTVLSQGMVNFSNDPSVLSGPFDRLVRFSGSSAACGHNIFGTNNAPVVGTNLVAQLYYGSTNGSQLIPVTNAPARFRPSTTSIPGTWEGGMRFLPGFNYGDTVVLNVRVWDSNFGPTYETSLGLRDASSFFYYQIPASPDAPLSSFSMVGFQGFFINSFSIPFGSPPRIFVEPWPASRVVLLGQYAMVSIETCDSPDLSSFWLHNGTYLPGPPAHAGYSLVINNVQHSNAGCYSVVLSNQFGMTTSSPSKLTVVGGPTSTCPATLTFSRFSNQNFGFTLIGEQESRYRVDVSPNLQQWTQLAIISNFSGTTPFFDPATDPVSRRFYRAVLLP